MLIDFDERIEKRKNIINRISDDCSFLDKCLDDCVQQNLLVLKSIHNCSKVLNSINEILQDYSCKN